MAPDAGGVESSGICAGVKGAAALLASTMQDHHTVDAVAVCGPNSMLAL